MASTMQPNRDLVAGMKYDPQLKIFVNGGYYDPAAPFDASWFEDHHLPIPILDSNIECHENESGHLVFSNEAPLQQLHESVAALADRTGNVQS